MSSTDQNQLIAALKERIALLENQLSQVIESQQRSNSSSTLTLKPPKSETFDGKNVDTFLFGLSKVFTFYNISSKKKVQLVGTYFRGAALRWDRYVNIPLIIFFRSIDFFFIFVFPSSSS